MTEVHVKDMENVTEILTRSDRLKADMNERDDYIRTLQVENVTLLSQADEFENIKTHLDHCNYELNDELLKLKARNETLLRENLTQSDRINDLERSLMGDVEEGRQEDLKQQVLDYQCEPAELRDHYENLK